MKINSKIILALGGESVGNFSVFCRDKVFLSEDFGDLLEDRNFTVFKKAVLSYLKENEIKLEVVVTDLHPLYVTTVWGKELAEKFNAEFVQVQHHVAHIMSAVGDFTWRLNRQVSPKVKPSQTIPYTLYPIPSFIGIACDGTGYGLDEKVWGGEIIKFQIPKSKFQINSKIQSPKITIERIGRLENQVMIGGDLAVREPARILIAILARIKNYELGIKGKEVRKRSFLEEESRYKRDDGKRCDLKEKFLENKDFVYHFVKKFYTKQEFEVLYSQLQQGFNCQETSSTGRILDAVSVLLGFAGNERGSKHEATRLLEKASEGAEPYDDIEVRISGYSNQTSSTKYQLLTTPLFEYLIEGLGQGKDKKRLAVTAQLYIAKGLFEIISKFQSINTKSTQKPKFQIPVFLGGGITNNKTISKYFEEKGAYLSKKIPRGDAGLSFGQIFGCFTMREKTSRLEINSSLKKKGA